MAPATATTSPQSGLAAAWTTYLNGNARLGDAAAQPSLTPLHQAWSTPLDGAAVYAEPLVAFGMVFAATEGDGVYALDAQDGHVVWHNSIGTPLSNVTARTGCGNIDPLGITSTPVIDTATHTLYVVGAVSTNNDPPVHHQLVGFDAYTGRQTSSTSADPDLPAAEDPKFLLQRAALTLANGRVYVGYGGNYGDCGTYHGWLVGIPVADPSTGHEGFDVTPAAGGGAIWQSGGGPSVDAEGNLFVTTGNPARGTSKRTPWAESILKLSPSLSSPPEASFQDTSAAGDADLGTGDATLLPDGHVFATGKTQVGFLLRQSDLSRVAPISGRICGSDPDGGAAYDAATTSLYVPCRDSGLQQIDLATDRTGWRAGQVNSTPVLANGELWALRYPDGVLQGIDPVSGRIVETVDLHVPLANFATPTIAGGRIFIGTTSGVIALAGPS